MNRAIPAFLISAALGAAGGAGLQALRQGTAGVSGNSSQAIGVSSIPAPQRSAAGAGTQPPAGPPRKKAAMPRPGLTELRTAPDAERLRLLVRWLPQADAAEVGALAMEWYPEAKGSGDATWQMLVQRWVEVDAAAAMSHSQKISRKFLLGHGMIDITTPLHYAYSALGKLDGNLAQAWLGGEKGPLLRRVAGNLTAILGKDKMKEWAMSLPERTDLDFLRNGKVYQELDLTDPAKAAASLTREQMRYQGESVASEWAKKDPAAALAWAKGQPESTIRSKALNVVLKELVKTDPASALAEIEAMPANAFRAGIGSAYAGALAKTNPEAAMAFVNSNLKGVARMEGIAAIAAARAASDPTGAFQMLKEHGVGDLKRLGLATAEIRSPTMTSSGYSGGPDFVADVLKAAAVKNPEGVMQFLSEAGSILLLKNRYPGESLDNPNSVGFLGRFLFKDWAGKDPAAAARWTANQPGSKAILNLAKTAAAPWFASDPTAVRSFAASLPAGPGRDRFVQTTADLMAVEDPVGALAWTIKTGTESSLGPVFQNLSRTNPEVAAAQFASMPAAVQASQAQELTDILGKRAPVAAVDFYQNLPVEQQASVKLYDTASSYARQDPQAASEWITTLPPTLAKDTAISGLVDYLIKQSSDPDPEAAAHWAAASIDAGGRDRRLKRVAEVWFQRDPAGAAGAIQSTALTNEVKQILLSYAPGK